MNRGRSVAFSLLFVTALAAAGARAQTPPFEALDDTLGPTRALLERYTADRANLRRFYDATMSARRIERSERFYAAWQDLLAATDFDALDQSQRIDFLLFKNQIAFELRALEHDRRKQAEIESLVPFAPTIVALHESRRQLEPVAPREAAATLAALVEEIDALKDGLEPPGEDEDDRAKTVANRAARRIRGLRNTLRSWYRFYEGYDPLFTWWVADPYAAANKALEGYADAVRKELVGVDPDDDDAIIGDPTGREELLSMLTYEMIPYTPEELIEIAGREYDWCLREMLRASNELGFGDDWHAALDHVKTLYVEPGEQPQLIRDLAYEAVEFLETRDLVTIPELCKETWRMEMLSPERQKVSPYFLGGEVIMVAFPTHEMTHADKLMSMRGNNRHFARATVQHELIPGHHLQGFMTSRHRTHRRIFRTPFWGEGWALYWEMQLWRLGFPDSPENRVGMLFWRMHRCARIVFSLSFHLGEMTADEAIDYLVENVGHERNNATAEVRRSVSGSYSPLYQAAYMLGGLQIRALHEELVQSGRMSDRAFHDAVLKQNAIPIEMVRAALTGQPLDRNFVSNWRFYGE